MDIDGADGEEGWCKRDLALRAVGDGLIGPGCDDDDVAALSVLGGQDGDVGIAVQADARVRDRVGEVAHCVVLDLPAGSPPGAGPGVVRAGGGGEISSSTSLARCTWVSETRPLLDQVAFELGEY